MRVLSVGAFVLLIVVIVGTRFWPIIERVEVIGAVHHSRATVMRLADIAPGDPFLWVTAFRLRTLAGDPWVLQARVTRHWPDTVAVYVLERTPALSDGRTAYALDGTVLPGVDADAHAFLPRLEGWGTPRVEEALELLGILEGHGVQVITYSPEGFEISLANATLFTPGVNALRAQWSAFESSYRGGRIAVYPWGVSTAP